MMQIELGGVGYNLQSASVVVLMEPQLKPSTETQAIARAHRMGQTRPVVVYRLIAANTIDERHPRSIQLQGRAVRPARPAQRARRGGRQFAWRPGRQRETTTVVVTPTVWPGTIASSCAWPLRNPRAMTCMSGEPARIVQSWRAAVELFSPQPIPEPDSRASVVDLGPGEPMPWEGRCECHHGPACVT